MFSGLLTLFFFFLVIVYFWIPQQSCHVPYRAGSHRLLELWIYSNYRSLARNNISVNQKNSAYYKKFIRYYLIWRCTCSFSRNLSVIKSPFLSWWLDWSAFIMNSFVVSRLPLNVISFHGVRRSASSSALPSPNRW